MSSAADAFAATEHITNGDWDDFLSAIGLAITQRARYLAKLESIKS